MSTSTNLLASILLCMVRRSWEIDTPNRKSNHYGQYPEGTPDGIAWSKGNSTDSRKTT
ncbi:hypothetical protein ACFL5Z_07320 [Planctomycetota bacterium]